MIMIKPKTIVAPPDSKCCLKVKKETNKLVNPIIVNKTIPRIRKSLKGESLNRSTDTPKLSPLGSNRTPSPPATAEIPTNNNKAAVPKGKIFVDFMILPSFKPLK